MMTENWLEQVRWTEDGLVPALAQEAGSGRLMMMAWMNREALEETLATGRVCYFSRSRKTLWRKGESSGQVQILKELRIDCDADTVLVKVDQTGPACHTGRRDCFYWKADADSVTIDKTPIIDPKELYKK